ncbi:MAG: hypothetical protein FWD15_03520 [Alphaproteobacteria bacterium]|nr:hypothetical protein [Alphaproteobacteria bacterium]
MALEHKVFEILDIKGFNDNNFYEKYTLRDDDGTTYSKLLRIGIGNVVNPEKKNVMSVFSIGDVQDVAIQINGIIMHKMKRQEVEKAIGKKSAISKWLIGRDYVKMEKMIKENEILFKDADKKKIPYDEYFQKPKKELIGILKSKGKN